MNYQIFNLLNNLKNAKQAKKSYIFLIKFNKIILNILNILWKEGFIFGYSLFYKKFFVLKIFLNKQSNFFFYQTFAKFNHLTFNNLLNISTNVFLIILSTNYGILSLKECKKKKIGGRILLVIK